MTTENIPEDLRSFVRGELGSGRYHSLDELLAAGLRLLRERETFLEEHTDEIRTQIGAGVVQAERGELVDGDEAMERLRRDLSERHREG
jgi:putative addiction module CopG family antidote